MSNESGDEWIFGVIVGSACVALVVFLMWKYDGLEWEQRKAVLANMLLLAVPAGAMWWWADEYSIFRFTNTWPIALAALSLCWWPALDFWASPFPDAPYILDMNRVWWATWYAKAALLIGCLGIPYGIKKMLRDY
jgi:hypothetical protein